MKKILQICAIDLSTDALLKPMILASMRQGDTVHSACTDTGRFGRLRDEGLIMLNIPIARKISAFSNLKSIYHLYKLMKKEKYDIVHVHTPIAAILGRIAAKLAGIKHTIYTAHGFYFHDEMPRNTYRFYYYLEKIFAKLFTDWLLLQSKEDYELCVKSQFKKTEHIIHISNGVDIENKFNPSVVSSKELDSLRREFKLSDEDIVFSFIGRFVREKGVFELLEAFKHLKNDRRHLKLLMIGDVLQSERDQESIMKLKQYFDENDDIIMPGFRRDIPELLSISDVFILPSHREGLPRSIIEAMAMSKPILASNIRGCREEVFHNENGYLVEKGDWQELYQKMKLLVDDAGKRESFGKRSRELVEDLFNEQKVIKLQLDLFNRLD